MKVRKGFVSNSSSSSFVCDITGRTEGGYDASLSDVGFAECVVGHTFETDNYPEVEKYIEEHEDGAYSVPENLCPICNGEAKPQIIKRLVNDMKFCRISVEDIALAAALK